MDILLKDAGIVVMDYLDRKKDAELSLPSNGWRQSLNIVVKDIAIRSIRHLAVLDAYVWPIHEEDYHLSMLGKQLARKIISYNKPMYIGHDETTYYMPTKNLLESNADLFFNFVFKSFYDRSKSFYDRRCFMPESPPVYEFLGEPLHVKAENICIDPHLEQYIIRIVQDAAGSVGEFFVMRDFASLSSDQSQS